MAVVTWNPSGGIEVGGCANVFHVKCIVLKFGIGDIAFVKKKAKNGILEKVAIKKVRASNKPETLINYVDTYNAIHVESGLVTHAEALALATAYLQNQIDLLSRLESCK